MGTENRTCRIIQITFGIVTISSYYLILIPAWCIAFQAAEQPASATGIRHYLFLIITHLRHCCCTDKYCYFPFCFRRIKSPLHFLDIGHGSSDKLCRYFQTKFIIRFQKDVFCLFQSLTNSPVSGLSEISSLCVFCMSPSSKKSDLYICQRRTCQNSQMFFFFQMGKNQSLPVLCKDIFTACCKKLTSAAWFSRFYEKMNFRIMTKRFKMSYAFYRLCNSFFVFPVPNSTAT